MSREVLSHRERVLRAIEHKPADRYPIDLGCHFSTGISAFAYHNLCQYLGFSTNHIEMIDSVQMLARVEQNVIDRFHIDTKLLRPRWNNPTAWHVRENYIFRVCNQLQPQIQPNGDYIVAMNGQKMRVPKDGYFFDGDWITVSELDENAYLTAVVQEADNMRENGDYFNMFKDFPGYFFDLEFACEMYTDPDTVIARNDETHRRNIALMEKILRLDVKDNINCVALNSDLGMQNAPLLRPEMYGEFCMPYVKKFCDFVHRNSDKKVFMHSCGSIEPLLPYIIEAGVDIINPVQISAANMQPELLKEKYGSKICFWGGGCNTQQVLGTKSPAEVKQNVKMLTDILKPNAGFVFNQVHNIMGNVPPENIVSMLDTAYENSWM